jgi:uncharacterized sulfatase
MTLPLYPENHYMEYVLKIVDRYQYDVVGIPEDEALLPEILKRRGYQTGIIGKWHLGDQKGSLPNDNGFDHFFGVLYSNDYEKLDIYKNYEVEIPSIPDQSILTRKYTDEAMGFIEEHKSSPFFLYLAHTAVHEPLSAGKQFQGASKAGLYGDAVEELDHSVGEILKKLNELKIKEETLVVFTSDNGPWWQGNPGTFRGRKNNIQDGGLRVPFIAYWPGTIPAGTVSEQLSINFDIFNTCLAITDTEIPKDRIIDGQSMLPLLMGEKKTIHDTFFYYDGPILVAVRHKNWKYQRRHLSDNGGYPLFSHGPFLFNLEIDPTESYNLIETYPEIADTLSEMLDVREREMNVNLRGWL